MKKILIGLAILMIIFIVYITIANSLTLGSFKIEGVKDIQDANAKLEDAEKSTKDIDTVYQQNLNGLKTSINELKDKKAKYESKLQATEGEDKDNTIVLKTYQLDFLFATVDTYAGKRGIDLQMDLKQGMTPQAYNIEFILLGSYTGITDFIYDIENDTSLNFRIENFQLMPSGISTDPNTPSSGDTSKLQATFTVQEIGIRLD